MPSPQEFAPPAPALIGVFGTPSAMMHWGVHVVRVLVAAVAGEHGIIHGNYLAEFVDAGSVERALPTLVCTSDCPEVLLCRFVSERGTPVVVFAEEPADVIDDVIAVGGVDHVNALRLAARSLCALQPLIGAPGATVLGRRHLERGVAEVVDQLLAALRLTATAEQRAAIDRRLGLVGGSATEGRPVTVRDHLAGLFPFVLARRRDLDPAAIDGPAMDGPTNVAPEPAGERPQAPAAGDAATVVAPTAGAAEVEAVALCYEGLAAGALLERAEWPASIFSDGDNLGQFVAGPCELIGPARIVVYGPYMHLPLGDWLSRVEIEIAENDSGNRLKVDLVSGPRVLVSASADMPTRGQYGFSLAFTVSEPLDPVELRFQIESGAIEGRFLLRRVLMTRRASPPGEAPAAGG